MTELNEKSGHNHVGEDQVSLVNIYGVTNTLQGFTFTAPSLQTYSYSKLTTSITDIHIHTLKTNKAHYVAQRGTENWAKAIVV